MRNSKLLSWLLVFGLLFFLPTSGTAAQPQKGEHIDVSLADGRVFKNVEVIRSDEESVLIRLEPYDRVQELGDASVPFAFDVHAMIYTDDAPTLESKLHQRFDRNRVNLVNERKEFFIVTMNELEIAVKELGAAIILTKLAEAREYRETVERKKTLIPV